MTFAITSNTFFLKTIQIYSLTPKTCFALGLRSLVFKLRYSRESQFFFFQIKETKGPSEESIWESLKKGANLTKKCHLRGGATSHGKCQRFCFLGTPLL